MKSKQALLKLQFIPKTACKYVHVCTSCSNMWVCVTKTLAVHNLFFVYFSVGFFIFYVCVCFCTSAHANNMLIQVHTVNHYKPEAYNVCIYNQISTGHNNRYTGKCQPINVWNTTITMANVNSWVCELQLLPWQMSTHECVNYNCYHGKYQPISVDYNWCHVNMANINPWLYGLQLLPWQMSTHKFVDYNWYHGKCQPLSVWITTDTMANVNPSVCGLQLIPWQMSTHECELQLLPWQMSTHEGVNYNWYQGKCQPMNVWITTIAMANVNPWMWGLQLLPWQMSIHECMDYNWYHGKCQPMSVWITNVLYYLDSL